MYKLPLPVGVPVFGASAATMSTSSKHGGGLVHCMLACPEVPVPDALAAVTWAGVPATICCDPPAVIPDEVTLPDENVKLVVDTGCIFISFPKVAEQGTSVVTYKYSVPTEIVWVSDENVCVPAPREVVSVPNNVDEPTTKVEPVENQSLRFVMSDGAYVPAVVNFALVSVVAFTATVKSVLYNTLFVVP